MTRLDTVLLHTPAQAWYAKRAGRRLAVLAYHGVDEPEMFARQVAILEREAHPVSLDDVLSAFRGTTRLPPRAALITFDDGWRSVLEHGMPTLARHAMPAVVFVVAGLIGSNAPFWWTEAEHLLRSGGKAADLPVLSASAAVRWLTRVPDERRLAALDELRRTAPAPAPPALHLTAGDLRELDAAGVSVGSHTLTHPCLDQCDNEKVVAEVNGAHDLLTAILGHEPRAFAYPNGASDPRVVRAVARAGYNAAFLFDHRLQRLPPVDPLRISRLRVDSTTSDERFRIVISGLHPAFHHARRRR